MIHSRHLLTRKCCCLSVKLGRQIMTRSGRVRILSTVCPHQPSTLFQRANQRDTIFQRSFCTTSIEELVMQHTHLVNSKPTLMGKKLDAGGVFTNSELRLSDVEVIGFDYDYTLAPYTKLLDKTIFDMIIEGLVSSRHYPSALSDLNYDPGFLARGIHYDINNGIFMKIDAYNRIQSETVHHCFRPLSISEISELYPGRRIHLDRQGSKASQRRYRQIVDIFEIPQLYAWCAVLNYLESCSSRAVHPSIVFEDIKNVTADLHLRGELHSEISANIGLYLKKNPKLVGMLAMLREQNKQLFILTNSPYNFIDVGMRHMMGPDWKDYFDVIICLSRKPKFFEDRQRVFRRISSNNVATFGEVTEFKKGEIYCEGNVKEFHALTGWDSDKILYFGDQMYADLAEPILNMGWHTGAIIRELAEEMELLNSYQYQDLMFKLTELDYLINGMQSFLPDPDAVLLTEKWCTERKQVRNKLRDLHSCSFGSIFRTHVTPTLFYRRLSRFAEIYTSDVTNLASYNASHYRFTPARTNLPHELTTRSLLDYDTFFVK